MKRSILILVPIFFFLFFSVEATSEMQYVPIVYTPINAESEKWNNQEYLGIIEESTMTREYTDSFYQICKRKDSAYPYCILYSLNLESENQTKQLCNLTVRPNENTSISNIGRLGKNIAVVELSWIRSGRVASEIRVLDVRHCDDGEYLYQSFVYAGFAMNSDSTLSILSLFNKDGIVTNYNFEGRRYDLRRFNATDSLSVFGFDSLRKNYFIRAKSQTTNDYKLYVLTVDNRFIDLPIVQPLFETVTDVILENPFDKSRFPINEYLICCVTQRTNTSTTVTCSLFGESGDEKALLEPIKHFTEPVLLIGVEQDEDHIMLLTSNQLDSCTHENDYLGCFDKNVTLTQFVKFKRYPLYTYEGTTSVKFDCSGSDRKSVHVSFSFSTVKYVCRKDDATDPSKSSVVAKEFTW